MNNDVTYHTYIPAGVTSPFLGPVKVAILGRDGEVAGIAEQPDEDAPLYITGPVNVRVTYVAL